MSGRVSVPQLMLTTGPCMGTGSARATIDDVIGAGRGSSVPMISGATGPCMGAGSARATIDDVIGAGRGSSVPLIGGDNWWLHGNRSCSRDDRRLQSGD